MSFGYDGPHATTVRPPHVPASATGNWAKDATSIEADDGTRITASFCNMIAGNLRALCTAYGVTMVEGADTLLASAVAAAITSHTHDDRYHTEAEIAALLAGYLTAAQTSSAIAIAIADLVASAPATLDTLNELAAALGSDPNFATTMTNSLAGKQPLDATLTALAAVATAADTLIYATGADTFAPANLTVFGRSLIDDADATAGRTTLAAVGTSRQVLTSGLATGGGDLSADRTITVPAASQAEAEAGTENTKAMTALRTAQAITAQASFSTPPAFNALINGELDIWQRGTSISCTSGARTYTADRIYVFPSGATLSMSRQTTLPTGARARYSMFVVGATSATAVLIGQRLEAADMPAIRRQVTFAAKIYNNTGANFTPTLLLGTPSAADNFTTVTNRLTQALQSCADGAWTTVKHTVDISGYTNIANGLQVEIEIPSGSLDAGTKTVYLTELELCPGAVQMTSRLRTPAEELARCRRYFQKSYAHDVDAGTAADAGSVAARQTLATASSMYHLIARLPVEMRATPTITWYNPSSGSANSVRNISASSNHTVSSSSYTNGNSTGIVVLSSATGAAGDGWNAHYTAAAEL